MPYGGERSAEDHSDAADLSSKEMEMKQAIDELKAIPGVVGACLFGAQEGLIQSNLPGIFKPEKLTEVGKQLTKLLVAGRLSFSDLSDLSLHYDESVVIARELRKGLTVFVICDPSFNHNLLTMSLNLLQEEMRGQVDVQRSGFAEDSTPRPAVPLASPPVAGTVDADLEPLLAELRALLAKVLGPMAAIIFDEVREQWAVQGAVASRVNELVKLLHVEIGDADKIKTFEALSAPLLKK
ncbi:MAG: hypothetical protein L3J63_09340 [Geopsychrobacter sp.]|nr:hypothetical protein [Geopsychrobacter sp.]